MKTLRLAIAAVMLLSLTVGMAEVKSSCSNKTNRVLLSEITAQEVINYLQNTFPPHYNITTPETTDGGYTWTCYTMVRGHHYFTTVKTDGVNIVIFEDLIIN